MTNRLRTQIDRTRVNMSKWDYSNETETCDCVIGPMAAPSAVPDVWRNVPGGRTRMIMMSDECEVLDSSKQISSHDLHKGARFYRFRQAVSSKF